MGKTVLIIAVAAVIIAGVYILLSKNTNQSSTAITSIRDALSKQTSTKCDFVDDDGKRNIAYVKNGAIRGDTSGPKQDDNGSIIYKDGIAHFWYKDAKEGFKIEVPADRIKEVEEELRFKAIIEGIEKNKDKCSASVVSDSMFIPPPEIQFSSINIGQPKQ